LKLNVKIGIMQGRLSKPIANQIQAFPTNSWINEFELAQKIGFNCIEWIFDDISNPIFTDYHKILELSVKFNIKINSVCADFFMKNLLFKENPQNIGIHLKILEKLIIQCNKLNISIIEIPLVDSSSLKTDEEKIQFCNNLSTILPLANSLNVHIVLETDLPPNDFKKLLQNFDTNQVKANYDVGNSTANRFNIKNELEILKPWIINIHIKDRLTGGVTVPLGTGDTDFEIFFTTLNQINYSGDLIIQGAREDLFQDNDPKITCTKYFNFIKNSLYKYS
jgi:L-ribulose-5-phosphate 3-epimerase